MTVEYIKDKDYTLEELQAIQDKLCDIRWDIAERIRKEEVKPYDYTGKYIHIRDYGYMYVTSQEHEKNSACGGERMNLYGLTFNGILGVYRDMSYVSYDAEGEWSIPTDSFMRYIRNNEIEVIDREKFMTLAGELIQNTLKEMSEWLDGLEKEKEEQT